MHVHLCMKKKSLCNGQLKEYFFNSKESCVTQFWKCTTQRPSQFKFGLIQIYVFWDFNFDFLLQYKA
jgi:hypothetical protein